MIFRISIALAGLLALSACSSTGGTAGTSSATATSSSFEMEVTDIDYGSLASDQRYLVSYSFPDARGRFAVQVTGQSGTIEPISDTSDIASVADDIAEQIICDSGPQKLQAAPAYITTNRAYQLSYACSGA